MNKMKYLMILALTFGLVFAATDRAVAQDKGKVWAGSCTPKKGDDVEVSIHTPQNNDPSTGQKSGVKYIFVTVVQGGTLSGTSIKGGRRTTAAFEFNQKQLSEVVKRLGARDGAKLGMTKITAVDGSFKLEKGDEVTGVTTGKAFKCTVSRKGKALGSFTFDVKW